MCLDIYCKGVLLGSVVRGGAGVVYAYSPAGRAVGTYADVDAAVAALSARQAA